MTAADKGEIERIRRGDIVDEPTAAPEQAGILEPFNVALSDLALLDAAEYSAKLKKPDAARAALGDLRKAWPRADQLPFLQQRLRVLENTLAAKPDPV
jgi:hypothetical protein